MPFRRAVLSSNLPTGSSTRVVLDRAMIAVFRTDDGRLFACQEACPHQEGSLSMGLVQIGKADTAPTLTCPLHQLVFNLASGAIVAGERAIIDETSAQTIQTYQTEERDGWVWVDVPSEGN